MCHCGCGEAVTRIKGREWRPYNKYMHGHRARLDRLPPIDETVCPHCGPSCPVGFGMCHCGCGYPTTRARTTIRRLGIRVGTPYRWRRGHFRAALDPESAAEIRRQALNGISQRDLARRFGVAVTTIHRVVMFENWAEAGIALPGQQTNRRLTPEIARMVRRRFLDDSTLTLSALAKEYNVSSQSIAQILKFRSYAYAGIAPPAGDQAAGGDG